MELHAWVECVGGNYSVPFPTPKLVNVDVIDIILELRNDARKNKDFSLSDKIRDMLNKKGISINDSDKNSSYTID